MSDLWDRLRRLERRVDRFSLIGDGTNVIASGSVREGYALNVLAAGAGAGSGVLPPPSVDCSFFATLFCDSISASKTKCGFSEYGTPSSPPKIYTEKTQVISSSVAINENSGAAVGTFDESGTCVTTFEKTTCAGSITGTLHRHVVQDGVTTDDYDLNCVDQLVGSDCPFIDYPFLAFNCSCAIYDICSTSTDSGLVADSPTTAHRTASFCQSGSFGVCDAGYSCSSSGSYSCSSTLSNEYTTAELISNTRGALPGYSGYFDCNYPEEFTPEAGQGCGCSASFDLSDDEANCTIQRFRYKFVFASYTGAPCNLRWVERFTPDSGPVVDTPKSFAIYPGMTETSIFYVLEPSENGAIAIV